MVITGAAGGIRRALTHGFVEVGALVLPVTRRDDIDWGDDITKDKDRFRPPRIDLSLPEVASD